MLTKERPDSFCEGQTKTRPERFEGREFDSLAEEGGRQLERIIGERCNMIHGLAYLAFQGQTNNVAGRKAALLAIVETAAAGRRQIEDLQSSNPTVADGDNFDESTRAFRVFAAAGGLAWALAHHPDDLVAALEPLDLDDFLCGIWESVASLCEAVGGEKDGD